MNEENDEILGERIEEAKNLLEKFEDLRRDPKYGNKKKTFFFIIRMIVF
jgi:hypothetical protein